MPQVHGKRMIDRRRVTAGTAALAAALAVPRLARAETAAEFYRGKTVRILVGSPPGGGYDIYARLVTPALAAKLGATVLVENKDGNGGLAALATLLTRPADGLTIMNGSAEAAIISQMLARPGATWDVTKLQLARQDGVGAEAVVRRQGRALSDRSPRRCKPPPLTWSATGPADDISDVQAIDLLCARAEVEDRHRLSRLRRHVARRHPQRSRLPACCRPTSALQHIGEIKPLAVFGAKRWAHLPDVPTLREAAALPADKTWIVDLARTDRRGAARHGGRARTCRPIASTICAACSPKSSPIPP